MEILCTVIGIAGTLSVCGVLLVASLFLKKLPNRLKRLLSALAAGMILFSLFKELAAQNLSIYAYKGIFTCVLYVGQIINISLFICVISVLFGKAFFRRDCIRIREEVPFDEPGVVNNANQNAELLSTPSVFWKISPVFLQ